MAGDGEEQWGSRNTAPQPNTQNDLLRWPGQWTCGIFNRVTPCCLGCCGGRWRKGISLPGEEPLGKPWVNPASLPGPLRGRRRGPEGPLDAFQGMMASVLPEAVGCVNCYRVPALETLGWALRGLDAWVRLSGSGRRTVAPGGCDGAESPSPLTRPPSSAFSSVLAQPGAGVQWPSAQSWKGQRELESPDTHLAICRHPDRLPEGGRHQVPLGLPEADRPPGSGSTARSPAPPACPGPHLLALLLCEAGRRACEMKLSLSLRFPWVLHLLGKTSALFKAYSRFSQVSFYCSMVDCFLVAFFLVPRSVRPT